MSTILHNCLDTFSRNCLQEVVYWNNCRLVLDLGYGWNCRHNYVLALRAQNSYNFLKWLFWNFLRNSLQTKQMERNMYLQFSSNFTRYELINHYIPLGCHWCPTKKWLCRQFWGSRFSWVALPAVMRSGRGHIVQVVSHPLQQEGEKLALSLWQKPAVKV